MVTLLGYLVGLTDPARWKSLTICRKDNGVWTNDTDCRVAMSWIFNKLSSLNKELV